ncbi:Phosphoglycolate phosphatase [Methylobacterium crusticola]|uniref:Phosphoglycolate phosphatase n=1 Tax=Methylobacterium crusticola TaxID=1697972 RepID=A0ABQ4QTE0_9HYPH|nr:HAD hydrolase-like protein [Methylobacterium crusticola]GJD48494.1 Phosphoglycolate phosphatase [Methylobacterium crusticola]
MSAPEPPYRLAILDFDGTLADTFPWFAGVLGGVADRYGFRRPAPDEVEALRGLEARAVLRRLEVPRWKLPLIARHVRALAARDGADFGLFPGIPALLRRLHAGGIVLAVVSSNREAVVRRVLGPSLAALIRHYACGTALFGKARTFRAVVRASGVAPARALCLGDEIRDRQAATRAGLAFGAVAWGYTRPDVLAAAGPDLCFASPDAVAASLLPAPVEPGP